MFVRRVKSRAPVAAAGRVSLGAGTSLSVGCLPIGVDLSDLRHWLQGCLGGSGAASHHEPISPPECRAGSRAASSWLQGVSEDAVVLS